MGISYETYVGPYVRCEVTRIDIAKTKRACPNTACKRYGKDGYGGHSFCAVCGTAIADIAYTEQGMAVDKWEVSEEIDERFSCPGGDGYYRWVEATHAHLWLPNVSVPWRNGQLEDRVDFELTDFASLTQPAQECADFIIFFEKELAHFRGRYGPDAVSVRWGIIQHYY